MGWRVDQEQLLKGKRSRVLGIIFLCYVCFMLATPKMSPSPKHHVFADMRNVLGLPNTINVITNFPFLVIGVIGFVLCLRGDFFEISLRGESLCWAIFYAGTAVMAFGSAYYHLKPSDNRLMWDTLPMMIAYSSLFSSVIVERAGMKIGLTCLCTLLILTAISATYLSMVNDLRLCLMFQLIPSVAIPWITFSFPSKYSHSRYWLWVAGIYLLSRFEAVADRKIYGMNTYIISGHSLEHLCLAAVPILLSVMLLSRSIRLQR